MRVSKDPDVRKREIIETAMRIFAQRGYEATSMTDIAKELHVVPGLCYRYFRSKQELYETALTLYAEECCAPIIKIIEQPGMTLDEYLGLFIEAFIKTDGKEKYHEFFHKEGNSMFHKQLEIVMLNKLLPSIKSFLDKLLIQGEIKIQDTDSAAKFILFGQMPIINDLTLNSREKADRVVAILKKLLY